MDMVADTDTRFRYTFAGEIDKHLKNYQLYIKELVHRKP